jgi:glycolate oxidase
MSDSMKQALIDIAGAANVLDDAATLDYYAHDQSLAPRRRPAFVVKVASQQQISAVVKVAAERRTPVVPFSSGTDFHGGAVPTLGGILLDMSGMKQITELDTREWSVTVAPGVTFSELQAALGK